MRGLTVGLSGEALNVSRALTTTSHLLGDMHTSYYQIDIMCACIFFHPFINVHLNQQNIVSFSHWKEKKKLHSNSRLFVKSITDLYMDFIYNIYINILIYIKYIKYMKMSFVFLMIKQNIWGEKLCGVQCGPMDLHSHGPLPCPEDYSVTSSSFFPTSLHKGNFLLLLSPHTLHWSSVSLQPV